MEPSVWTVVVAGGSGHRFGGEKQFEEIAGATVLDHSIRVALEASDGVVVVVPDAHVAGLAERIAHLADIAVVAGGRSRADSVRCGLRAVPASASIVLVHDAARPAASGNLFRRVLDALRAGERAVVPVVPVADTLRAASGRHDVVDRAAVVAVQTPQGFDAATLRAAHGAGSDATDDASLVDALGVAIAVVDGERTNIKITERDDLLMVDAVIRDRAGRVDGPTDR